MQLRDAADLAKATFKQWNEHKSARLAGALAYYTVFSIAPILIIAIAVVGLVFGHDAASHQILGQIGGLVGQKGEHQLTSMVSAANKPASGIIATVIGIVTLIFGATGVVIQLQDALDVVWAAKEDPKGGLWQTIRTRLLSIGMLLALVFLLLVSLLVGAVLTAVNTYTTKLMPSLAYLTQFLNVLFDITVLSLLFAIIFKFLPKVPVEWKDVRIGSIITAVLFAVGQFAITLYLGKMNSNSPYGDAGALIIVLLWVYYSAQLLLLGAEFTNIWATRHESRPRGRQGRSRTERKTSLAGG